MDLVGCRIYKETQGNDAIKKQENNKGPNIEPWGIPHGMLAGIDKTFPKETTKLVGCSVFVENVLVVLV